MNRLKEGRLKQCLRVLIGFEKSSFKIPALPLIKGFPRGSAVKNTSANAGDAGDAGSIPGLGRSPGGGNGNPFQHSCLENPIEKRDWQATVHGVAMNQV